LSDVTPADANSERREWHPKAEFVSDILKENGKTKLVGEGQYKHYHKTKLIADILKESDNTKLIGEGGKHYRNNFQQQPYDSKQDPCEWERVLMNDCINSSYNPYFPDAAEKHALCLECLQDAWDEVPVGTSCTTLKEIGFWDDVISCEQLCMLDCSAQTDDLLRCAVVQDGCDGPTFDRECLSGIQVLSDVAPAEHPKAEFVSDIHKENGKTKLIGEGQYKHYHKTKLITDILKESDNTKLIGEGRKHYHKTKSITDILKESNNTKQDPCEFERMVMNDCIEDFPWTPDPDEHDLCLECLDDAWDDVAIGTSCDSLQEIRFCDTSLIVRIGFATTCASM